MNSERVGALRRLLFLALCVAALSLFAPRSQAQESGDEGAYRELIEQALSEFKHKNWPEARVLFVRAHELNPNARTLRGMGIVSFEMRDYLGAVVNLKAALEDTRQPLTEAQRKECESLLTRARTYVGVFAVKLEPAAAELLLDGIAPTRDEEGKLLVSFGEHVLSARAPGYQESATKLVVQGGERGEVTLTLEPAGVASAPVLTPTQPTPAEPAASPAASQPAPARNYGHEDHRFIGHGLKYTWVALGASALFGGGAALFWALGDKKLDDLDKQCRDQAASSPCTRGNTNTDSVERYELATNISIGVSAAALATAAVLMGLEWPRERNISVSFSDKAVFLRGAF